MVNIYVRRPRLRQMCKTLSGIDNTHDIRSLVINIFQLMKFAYMEKELIRSILEYKMNHIVKDK